MFCLLLKSVTRRLGITGLVAILFASFFQTAAAQKDSGAHFITLDVTGLLFNSHPGIGFQCEHKSLQGRLNLNFNYVTSKTPTDSSVITNSVFIFTPSLGLAWVKTFNRFSFYAGSDVYYFFNKRKSSLPPPAYNPKVTNWGFRPVIGFRYPFSDRFFLGIEGMSDISLHSYYNQKNQKVTSFNINFFDRYNVYLAYRF